MPTADRVITTHVLGAVFAIGLPSAVAQAPWSAQQAPIMTQWASQVSPENVHPEYPRPMMKRDDWQNLNGLWQFAANNQDEIEESPPIGKDLPGQILVPFPIESARSGVMEHHERIWYRRTFALPAEWRDQRVLLHFGAVDWQARVWVNGTFLGEHRGGYDAFSFDITNAMRENGEQELIVGVWDPSDAGTQPRGKQMRKPHGIWYTPVTGIWQTVWLEPVPRTYIESFKIVPDVDRHSVTVSVKIAGDQETNCELIITAEHTSISATGPASAAVELNLDEHYKQLWSPAKPQLYDLTIETKRDGKTIDAVSTYFALRKIEVGPDEKGVPRLLLNGEPLFHIGTLDQGFWPDGIYTAPTDEALRYDIEVTKRLGFNAIRKHVKVEPQRWYYWCDALGVLVWQDMPSGDASVAPGKGEITRGKESAQQFEIELGRLIEQHQNHPSIVMWVIFNEGWGQYDTTRLAAMVKSLDPTRLVNSASGWNDLNVGDVHDIHSYPGPDSPPIDKVRAALLGEFGGLGLGVKGHTWAESQWGYRGTANAEELTRQYEQLMRRVWDLRDKRGLAAAIYTQITDVETECNGLLTYDRKIIKPDVDRIRAANEGRLPRLVPVVPAADTQDATWRYTLANPVKGWEKPDFDDSTWPRGKAGFGRAGTPGAVVRTDWHTTEIWLRREFDLDDSPRDRLRLYVHHDEDADIYINGVLAARLSGYSTTYEDWPLSNEALAALRPGRNTLAVLCRQTTGGQYIDVGLVRLESP